MGKRILEKGTVVWLMMSAGLISMISLQTKEASWILPPVTAATFKPLLSKVSDDHVELVNLPNAGLIEAIIERPLFSASRQPFSHPEQKIAAKPIIKAEPLTLTLTGILLTGESRIALLKHPTDGLKRFHLGQMVDGWRVDEIREDEIHLQRGTEVKRLSLRLGAFNPAR